MYPKNRIQSAIQNQRGSMLVLALFVIIVLALLGLTMTRLLSSTSQSIVYEVLGQRALNAARAGIECRISEQYPVLNPVNCQEAANKTFIGVPGLENCSYTTTYSGTITVTDDAKSVDYGKFTSTGQCSAGNVIVSRTVYADARH